MLKFGSTSCAISSKISSIVSGQDVLTKNLTQDIFERHVKVLRGEDQYMKKKTEVGNLQIDEDE
jgi:uncharacterized protein YbjQ (UPF0145 family)